MKKNEKNFIQNEKKEELNEKELDNVAGGYVAYSPLGGDFAEAYGYSKKTES